MIERNWQINKYIASTRKNISALLTRRSFRYGLPFLLFVVGGSFGLKQWTQIRYQFSQVKGVGKEEAQKLGLKKDKDVTLESVFEDVQKLDIDNWENKRGPRPWEPSSVEQNKMK